MGTKSHTARCTTGITVSEIQAQAPFGESCIWEANLKLLHEIKCYRQWPLPMWQPCKKGERQPRSTSPQSNSPGSALGCQVQTVVGRGAQAYLEPLERPHTLLPRQGALLLSSHCSSSKCSPTSAAITSGGFQNASQALRAHSLRNSSTVSCKSKQSLTGS